MDFFYGSAPCTILDIVRSVPELFAGHAMLVTCLHKSMYVCEVLQGGVDTAPVAFRAIGNAALVAPPDVEAFLTSRYLSRFDELWFFRDLTVRGELALESRPAPRFTSDLQDFSRPPSNAFLEYFSLVGARFALADGFDLNHAAGDRTMLSAIAGLRF